MRSRLAIPTILAVAQLDLRIKVIHSDQEIDPMKL